MKDNETQSKNNLLLLFEIEPYYILTSEKEKSYTIQ